MLFEPITLRSLTIPNRVWMSPMCQYSAATDGPDIGAPHDWHFAHLAARAAGGTGLIIAEATAVSPKDESAPPTSALWNDRQQARVHPDRRLPVPAGHHPRRATRPRRAQGLHRPPLARRRPGEPRRGRLAARRPQPDPLRRRPPAPPKNSRPAEIDRIVADFAAAAERALHAGFQVIEIHGAHGYLIARVPLACTPTTAPTATAARSRTASASPWKSPTPCAPSGREHLPVFFRVSATDWLPGHQGWTVDDTVRLSKELLAHGIDLLDVSTRRQRGDRRRSPPAPDTRFPSPPAYAPRPTSPVAAVGQITDPAPGRIDPHHRTGRRRTARPRAHPRPLLAPPRRPHAGRQDGPARPVPQRHLTARRAPARTVGRPGVERGRPAVARTILEPRRPAGSSAEARGQAAEELAAADHVQGQDGQRGEHDGGQHRRHVHAVLALEGPQGERQRPVARVSG